MKSKRLIKNKTFLDDLSKKALFFTLIARFARAEPK